MHLNKESDARVAKIADKLTGRKGHPASDLQKETVSKYWKNRKRGPMSDAHKEKLDKTRPSHKGSKWMKNFTTDHKLRVPKESINLYLEMGYEFSSSRGTKVYIKELGQTR